MKKKNEDTNREIDSLSKKVKDITTANKELLQVIERKERHNQNAEGKALKYKNDKNLNKNY